VAATTRTERVVKDDSGVKHGVYAEETLNAEGKVVRQTVGFTVGGAF
jgi:hypothetical protein